MLYHSVSRRPAGTLLPAGGELSLDYSYFTEQRRPSVESHGNGEWNKENSFTCAYAAVRHARCRLLMLVFLLQKWKVVAYFSRFESSESSILSRLRVDLRYTVQVSQFSFFSLSGGTNQIWLRWTSKEKKKHEIGYCETGLRPPFCVEKKKNMHLIWAWTTDTMCLWLFFGRKVSRFMYYARGIVSPGPEA